VWCGGTWTEKGFELGTIKTTKKSLRGERQKDGLGSRFSRGAKVGHASELKKRSRGELERKG